MPKTSITGPQVSVSFDGRRSDSKPDVDKLKQWPTTRLIRRLIVAVCLETGFAYESEDREISDYLRLQISRFERYLIRTMMFGCVDRGWRTYEYGITYQGANSNLDFIKTLNSDHIEIMLDHATGEFAGIVYSDVNTGRELVLPTGRALWINFEEDGYNEFGEALIDGTRIPYEMWTDANESAKRYDRKVAGGFILIKYPVGQTPYKGVMTPNEKIADEIYAALVASGGATIPVEVRDSFDGESDKMYEKWRIELLDSSGAQSAFIDRLKYLDALGIRSMGWTERSVTEGNFGTKAEARVHGDMALLSTMTLFQQGIDCINEQLVGPMLMEEFGEDAEGRIEIAPIDDQKREFFSSLLDKLLANQMTSIDFVDRLDIGAIMDMLDIPQAERNDDSIPSLLVEDEEDDERANGFDGPGGGGLVGTVRGPDQEDIR